jgi:FlaA1/EpsC-like NDP-sugar epimerase
MTRIPSTPFWLLAWCLSMGAIALPRFAIRYASELRSGSEPAHGAPKRSLLYGAGWGGVMVARSAMRLPDAGVKPIGFLDDDPHLAGRRVAGLRVFGDLGTLETAVRKSRATSLLITMPSAPGDAVRRVAEAAMGLGLDVRTVPPMTDLLDGALDASRVRRLRLEDLLRRPVASEHAPSVREVFTDKTVVITGAAGSIGSELGRQVLAINPRTVVLVDAAESPLFHVEQELRHQVGERQVRDGRAASEVVAHLVDVTDRAVIARLFARIKPDVVLHAAAYKHVPMLEDHPSEAIRVNIGGTLSVVEAASAAGAERFVLVSTDKAVWPSSVMGASKRVAEMIVADAGSRLGRPYITVRFGNVLGSNGSVVPIFQEQLEKGRPITITHPEMTRYFMTIPEASWLILDAGAIADRAGLFVLDMGEPVRILDVARDIMRLAGRDPDTVPVTFIGLRRGEKLHETLFYDREAVQATEVPKILRSEAPRPPIGIREDVRHLIELAQGAREEHLRASLHAYVRWATVAHDYPVEGGDDETSAAMAVAEPSREMVAIPVHEPTETDAPSPFFGSITFAPTGAAAATDQGSPQGADRSGAWLVH